MKHSIVTITPTYAAQLLETNVKNRKIDDNMVAQYARDMSNNTWKINGETIKVSKNGILLDGQHRLMASVRSDHEFVTMFVEGLDEDSFTTIDIGKKRNAAAILHIAGYKSTHTLGATVRWLPVIRAGTLSKAHSIQNRKMTPEQILEFIEANPLVVNSVKECSGKLAKIIATSLSSPVHYLAYLKDKELCEKYFNDIRFGENLKRGDPAWAVRNALMNRSERRNGAEVILFLIKGWNALRAGKTVEAMRSFNRENREDLISPQVE
jgi:hypothetical protein